MTDHAADRAADIFLKHEKVSALLREAGREGMLALDPANFAWLTAGACTAASADPADQPALYLQGPQRWLLCSNVDTQRLFDEELDGLGFGVKEWPWYGGRARLLGDLVHGKKAACDVPFDGCQDLGERLRLMRQTLSVGDQARIHDLGKAVSHALEATCRSLECGHSEEETAGQVCHRLVHHGIQPVAVQVCGDGRNRVYRRRRATAAPIERTCIVQVAARRSGLHVQAARAVSFGPLDEAARREFDLAQRCCAVQMTSSTARTKPADILAIGARMLQQGGHEHEWRLAPGGWLTGYAPVERLFVPADAGEPLEMGHAVVWQTGVGAALSADTMLVTEAGPQLVTPPESWPVRRMTIAGMTIDRPDVLVR